MGKISIRLFCAGVLALLLTACAGNEVKEENNTIVTTTNIIGSSIKDIVGKEVEVIHLMNSEIDPHAYNASPNDYKQISNAKVVISNGLHLEGKMHESLLNVRKSGGNLILMSDGLTKDQIISEEEGVSDPHIWFDVMNWYSCLEHATKSLCEVYPEHQATWMERLDSIKQVYVQLDTDVQTQLNEIPDSTRYLVTAHDAFSYYSNAYGIKIKPLQGRNTNDEPSAKDIVELSDFIHSHGIKSIFVETTVNKSFIESIVESVKEKGGNVTVGGELFSDALGIEGSKEATYHGMITHNTETIVNALK